MNSAECMEFAGWRWTTIPCGVSVVQLFHNTFTVSLFLFSWKAAFTLFSFVHFRFLSIKCNLIIGNSNRPTLFEKGAPRPLCETCSIEDNTFTISYPNDGGVWNPHLFILIHDIQANPTFRSNPSRIGSVKGTCFYVLLLSWLGFVLYTVLCRLVFWIATLTGLHLFASHIGPLVRGASIVSVCDIPL